MKNFKRILTITVIAVITINTLISLKKSLANAGLGISERPPIRVAVLLYKSDDPYISLVSQSLEEFQKKSEGKVEVTFYDGKNDQAIQNKSIDSLLQDDIVDLLLLNLVDTESAQPVINKIKEKNIPVVLFNREPNNIESVRSYNKAYFVGTNPAEAGVLQGKILIDLWNKNKKAIDANGDNIMQYIMLMGERNNLEAIGRTKYSILTINDTGIKTEEIALRVCNWDESLAKDTTEALFLQNGNRIEAIISNNDAMAIGAIEALQEYGYNQGDKTKTITVIGVDAIPAAQDLIKKGFMAGSVLQDAPTMAEAMYDIGMNLVYGKAPLDGTQYKFDDTGVAVRIPYKEYVYNPNAA